jgi:4-cresol dehydrogenase (hydroxylating)
MNPVYPPGLSPSDFADFVKELQGVVGKDYVFTDPQWDLPSYNDQYAMLDKSYTQASGGVAPANVTEVQGVLAVARKYNVPLWTTSTGKNFAYGGPAPRKAGYMVLDLKRMNRILEVNEKYGYAVVEPGVNYFDFHNHLKATGSKYWADVAAPGWGSVLGNMVDHGAGYTPYGDHLLMQCGMEVVLSDGTVVQTAMGALPNSKTTNLYKYGLGPWVEGIFTQSNFGVVTKVGIWLMPDPGGYMPFMITFNNEHDLAEIMERARPLCLNMIIPSAATAVEMLWDAAVTKTRRDYYSGTGPLPDSVRQKICSDLSIGRWNFYAALYGPPEVMDANMEIIRDSLGSIPGAKFYFKDDRKGDAGWAYRMKLAAGIPNMTEFCIMNWLTSGAHADFSPISPPSGADAMKQYHLIKEPCNKAGFDYMGEMLIGFRSMHHIFCLMFNSSDPAEKKRAYDLFGEVVHAAAQAGYGEYRTNVDYMDIVANTYSWNNNAQQRLRQKLKDGLDPPGILSPGKMGIWPSGKQGA